MRISGERDYIQLVQLGRYPLWKSYLKGFCQLNLLPSGFPLGSASEDPKRTWREGDSKVSIFTVTRYIMTYWSMTDGTYEGGPMRLQ